MSLTAEAATITYEFGGMMGDDYGGTGGMTFTGRFSYESDAPDTYTGSYANAAMFAYNSFWFQVGGDMVQADLTTTAPGTPSKILIDDDSSVANDYQFIVNANPATGTIGTYASVDAFLIGFSGSSAVNGQVIPPGGLTLSDFAFSNLSGIGVLSNGVKVSFGGRFTYLREVAGIPAVPVPPTMPMLLLGIGVLGLAAAPGRQLART